MNLVPDAFSKSSLNYWCTWGAQHPRYSITTDEEWNAFNLTGIAVENAMRNRMDQEALFGSPGWATKFWPKLRSELYFCLDDGWDVPYDVNAHGERWRFGSLILDEMRFPDFNGTPAERLKQLNDKIKGLGWRGLALWVAAQCEGDDRDGQFFSPEACKSYWRERAKWSAEAGIEYWKVDWGVRNTDQSFRRMLTDLAREEAPNLTVEHALCMMPANNITGSGRFGDWANFATPSTDILNFSDAFRRYDVMGNGVGIASALDRIDTWLQQAHMESAARGIINCEDDVYLAAAMGGALGILCVPVRNPYTKWQWPRVDEISRALRWQRIAPAFGVGAAKALTSERILTDSNTVGVDYWYREVAGKTVEQHAPAVMSRGVVLPTAICDGEPPYVVASRHPNGAIAIATLRRCVNGQTLYPLADVALDIQDTEHPIGIFGSFRTLTLRFPHALPSLQVWAQDLLADSAEDVTDRVKIADRSLVLDGTFIEQAGRVAAAESDASDPGLILRLEKSVR